MKSTAPSREASSRGSGKPRHAERAENVDVEVLDGFGLGFVR